jgi:hypothetical protein
MHVQFTRTWTTKTSRLKDQSQVLGQSAYERFFDQFHQPLMKSDRQLYHSEENAICVEKEGRKYCMFVEKSNLV